MADMELLLEAERRGILPEDKKALLAEARNRGLVPKTESQEAPVGAPEPVEESWLQGAALKGGKFVSALAAETAGMVGGARVGAQIGANAGPYGAIAGGVLGAGLGYGAAKGAERVAGGEPVRAQTPVEGMAYEMGGSIVGYGVGKAWGALANRILPKRDPELVSLYKKFGITPRPTEVSPTSKTATIMESALGYHPISGDIAVENSIQRMEQYNHIYKQLTERGAPTKDLHEIGHKIKQEAGEFIKKYVAAGDEEVSKLTTKFMDQMGIPQPTSLSLKYVGGNLIKDVFKAKQDAMKADTESAYRAVDDLLGNAKGETVPLSENTAFQAQKLLEQELAKAPALQNKKVIKTLKSFAVEQGNLESEVLKRIDPDGTKGYRAAFADNPALRDQILATYESSIAVPQRAGFTWDGMKGNVSALKERVREIFRSQGKATDEARGYQQMIDALEADMGTFAQSKGDDIWGAYVKAKTASRQYHELFDKDVLGIMELSGEQLVKKLTASPVDFLNQVRQIGGDETIGAIKSLYLKDTFEKSLDKAGKLDPTKFMSNLRKLGQDKLNALIPQEQQRLLDAYTKKLNLVSERFFGANRASELELLDVITGTSNESVARYIINSKNRNVITYAKNIFSPERLLEVQEQAVLQTLATSPQGNFMPSKAARNFFANEKNLKALLPEEVFTDLKGFVKMAGNDKRVEALATNASHTGQVLIGHSMFTHPLTAIKTMGLSWALAKIYFNDGARTLFVKALKYPANHPQAIADFTKAWSLAIGNVLTQQDIPEGIGL